MRSLVSYLNERNSQDLTYIARAWQADQTDRLYSGYAYELSKEMQNEFLERRLLESMKVADLDQLQKFLTQADFTLDPAQQAAGFVEDITHLRQLGLIFEDRVKKEPGDPPEETITPAAKRRGGWSDLYHRGGNRAPDPTTKPVWLVPRELGRPLSRLVKEKLAGQEKVTKPYLAPSRQPLLSLLRRLEPELLEIQAEYWGILTLLGDAEPDKLATELVRVMTDKDSQARLLNDIPAPSQELFDELKAVQGRTTLPVLLERFVSLRRLYRDLRPLTEQLLVWESFENGQSVIFIPDEILHAVVGEAPDHQPLQTIAPPPEINPWPPYALAWDVLTFLNYISQNEVSLTANRAIPKRDIKKLAALLWPAPEDLQIYRLGFLVELCRLEKLYNVDEETGTRLLPGSHLSEWLEFDLYQQTALLVQTWQQNAARIGPISYPYYYANQTAVQRSNETMLGWLSQCKPEQWYSLASLQQKVQHENPYFIIPRRDLLNTLGLQRLTEFSKAWHRLEGELIYQTFKTAFEWFGILKVGYDGSDRITAFQLTQFGASLTGQAGAVQPVIEPTEKPLLVQPNFEILLFNPQTEALWMLQKIANLKQLDQVSVFTLSRESILRGLESGLSKADIINWLADHSLQPLPQNLAVSLEDWSKGFRRVTIEAAVLLEVEDAAVLDELLRSKQYEGYFVRRLSPTAAIVNLPEGIETRRNSPLKTFKSRLRTGGFYAQ